MAWTLSADSTYLPGRLARSMQPLGIPGNDWRFAQPCDAGGGSVPGNEVAITGLYAAAPEWSRLYVRMSQPNHNAPMLTWHRADYHPGTDTWTESTITPSAYLTHPRPFVLAEFQASDLLHFPVPAATMVPAVVGVPPWFPFLPVRITASAGWIAAEGNLGQTGAAAESSHAPWANYRRALLATSEAPTVLAIDNPSMPASGPDPGAANDYAWPNRWGGTRAWAWFSGSVRLVVPPEWKGAWNTDASYAAGDRVVHAGNFYQAATPQTPADPAPPSAGWTATPSWPWAASHTSWQAAAFPDVHPDFPNCVRLTFRVTPTDYAATPSPTITLAAGLVVSATDGTPYAPVAELVQHRKFAAMVGMVGPMANLGTIAPGGSAIAPQIAAEDVEPGILRVHHGIPTHTLATRAWTDQAGWTPPLVWPLSRRWLPTGAEYMAGHPHQMLATVEIDGFSAITAYMDTMTKPAVVAPLVWPQLPGILHNAGQDSPYMWHHRTRRLLPLHRYLYDHPDDGVWHDLGLGTDAAVIVPTDLAIPPSLATLPVRAAFTDDSVAHPGVGYPGDRLWKLDLARWPSGDGEETGWPAALDIQDADRITVGIAMRPEVVPTPLGRWPARWCGGGPHTRRTMESYTYRTIAGFEWTYVHPICHASGFLVGLDAAGNGYPAMYRDIFVWLGDLCGGTWWGAPFVGIDAYASDASGYGVTASFPVVVEIYRLPDDAQDHAPYYSNSPNDRGNDPPASAVLVGTKAYTMTARGWHFAGIPDWDPVASYAPYDSVVTGTDPHKVAWYWNNPNPSMPGDEPGVHPDWVSTVTPPVLSFAVHHLPSDTEINQAICTDSPTAGRRWTYAARVRYPVDMFQDMPAFQALRGGFRWHYQAPDIPSTVTVTGAPDLACRGRIYPGTVAGDLGPGT